MNWMCSKEDKTKIKRLNNELLKSCIGMLIIITFFMLCAIIPFIYSSQMYISDPSIESIILFGTTTMSLLVIKDTLKVIL